MAYRSFAELKEAAEKAGSLAAAVVALEADERATNTDSVRTQMRESLGVMREAVARGLSGRSARARD